MTHPSRGAGFRGVIFDLDGTLIDSYDAITASLNHALTRLGEPELPVDRVRRMVGQGLESLVARAVGEDRVGEGVRLFREHYARVAVPTTTALPGVVPTLRALRGRGYHMGVTSNKPARFGSLILDALEMSPYLSGVLGPDVVEHPKPHPEMVHRMLEILELTPDEAVYVGDMGVDAETCRNAGVVCWLIPSGSCTAEELATAGGDRVLTSFPQLLEDLPPLQSSA